MSDADKLLALLREPFHGPVGRQAADLIERLSYECSRWREVVEKAPDWKKLWAEQQERAEKAEAELAKAHGAKPCD